MKYILSTIGLLITFGTAAQEITGNQHQFKAKKIATLDLSEKASDWNARVINLEMPHPGGDSYRAFLQQQKAVQRERFPVRDRAKPVTPRGEDVIPPEIGQMFDGNEYNSSVPMDNSIAISNDGLLISAINSTMWLFDVTTNELLESGSYDNFLDNNLGIQSRYDPKISYDPINDRFQVVHLYANSPGLSRIVVAFSATSDPMGEWNIYEIPGNPLSNNRWTDYPAISQNAEDFFITANLIIPGEPWQTGFDGSIIWQMNKESGYNGAEELDITLWDGITFGGSFVRNLNPADGANCFDDNNMYFLSNRNFALQNDTIFLLEITDVLSSGEAELTVQALSSSDSYFLAPAARQADDHTFDTNDSRVLGAVLFENSIQFVQNCLDTTNGVTAVYHGFINDLNGEPQVSGNIISYPSDLDLGYPNIAHIGNPGEDEHTLISFVHTGPEVFSGFSCVLYDAFANSYSDRLVLKEGEDYVDILFGTYERWGDYSGSQTVYNLPGTVWVSGSYGNDLQRNATWIAELSTGGQFVGIAEDEQKMYSTAFPNPVNNYMSVILTLPETTIATISLFDAAGRHVADLYQDRIKVGRNELTFDLSPLATGQYVLRVMDSAGGTITEKLIKK